MILAAYRAGVPLTEHPEDHTQPLPRLPGSVMSGTPEAVARRLLGMLIVRDDAAGRRIARIVETEAYAGPEDRASHARAGRTPRTSVMFGPAGRAYVYLVYGLHHCLNVVCGRDGEAGAVLIRAAEPMVGVELMRTRRGSNAGPDTRLTAGPARTCQALDIDRSHDGLDLIAGEGLWLASDGADPVPAERILSGPRVGVDYAGEEWATRPWRFGIAGSPSLSRPFPESP